MGCLTSFPRDQLSLLSSHFLLNQFLRLQRVARHTLSLKEFVQMQEGPPWSLTSHSVALDISPSLSHPLRGANTTLSEETGCDARREANTLGMLVVVRRMLSVYSLT